MQYGDGTDVRLGDRIRYGDVEGHIVCNIDGKEYTPDFPAYAWAYLGRGIMIETNKDGLVHCAATMEDLMLVSRATA